MVSMGSVELRLSALKGNVNASDSPHVGLTGRHLLHISASGSLVCDYAFSTGKILSGTVHGCDATLEENHPQCAGSL
jgi:hypothetical protein